MQKSAWMYEKHLIFNANPVSDELSIIKLIIHATGLAWKVV